MKGPEKQITTGGICLSRDEVRDLCRTPQKARQLAFLRRNGIRHYVDAHGWPVVIRNNVEGTQSAKSADQEWEHGKAA